VVLVVLLLACATAHPVERDSGGGGGDSIRWKTLQLLVAGDLEGAGQHYLLATGSSEGAAGIIGFELEDGTVQQVSVNGFHVAVRCGDRIYDAFTGPTGMRVAEYLTHLVPGMQRFPITVQQ